MPLPIRVKPSSLLSTSLRGSLLDGAYTAGVAYASPLRRGQMSPRLVMFLAAFTTLVLLVSNFNSPATIQPPLENQAFMEDPLSVIRAPCGFDVIPWIPPPRHRGPMEGAHCCFDVIPRIPPPRLREPVAIRPAVTRRFPGKCPLGALHIEDEICESDQAFTNFTEFPEHFMATSSLHSKPVNKVRDIKLLLAILALFLLITLRSLQASAKPRRYSETSRLSRAFCTDNPTFKSFVETWDSSESSFIPSASREQIYFPDHEEVLRTINGLSASPSDSIPTSHPPTISSRVATLYRFPARILSFERMPVEQGHTSDHTFGTGISSSGSSTSSFDGAYEDFEVEEVGIDYY